MAIRLLLIAATAISNAQAQQPDKLKSFFDKAREQTDIRSIDSPGFLLQGKIRVTTAKGVNDGSYSYLRVAEGRWKETIELPGYKRVRSGDGVQFWQVRSQNDEDVGVEELDLVLRSRRAPKVQEAAQLADIKLKTEPGLPIECIKLTGQSGFGSAYCFNEKTSDLVEVYFGRKAKELPWKVDWENFSHYQQWSGKRMPLLLEGYNEDHIAVAAQLEIKPVPTLASDFFATPEGATIWADCEGNAVWKLKTLVQPKYPADARMRGQDGAVVLRGIIEEDGRISNIKSVSSRWPELYGAAQLAVSQWRYERTPECTGSKGRTETFIDVFFSLRR